MSEMKKVYHLLHNELDRLETKNFDVTTLYAVDESTGDLVPIAEGMPEDAQTIVDYIRKKDSKSITFAMLWQEVQINMARVLSGNSLRILTLIVGKMNFENCAYGMTYRKIAELLSMSSRTVIRSLRELQDKGVLIVTGKKGNKIYHVNPAYAWKGSFQRMKYKMRMFDTVMKEEGELWLKKK
jgi:Fic family protein